MPQQQQQQHGEQPQLPQLQTQLSEATALRLFSRMTHGNAAVPQLQPQPQQEEEQQQQQLQPEMPEQQESPMPAAAPLPIDDNCNGSATAATSGTTSSVPAAVTANTQLGIVLPQSGGQPTHPSQESVHSANEFGNSCRICRYHRSDMEIINCPCKCKGSVVRFERLD